MLNQDSRSSRNMTGRLQELQMKTINQALVAMAIFGVFAVLSAIVRGQSFGFTSSFIPMVTCFALLWVAALFRHVLSFRVKLVLMGVVVITALFFGFRAYGFLASAKVGIALIPVIFSFFISYRVGIGTLLCLLAMYLVFGYLYSEGYLLYRVDIDQYSKNFISWFTEAQIILLVSWALLYVSKNYRNSLIASYESLEAANYELAEKEERYRTLFETSNDAILLIKDRKVFHCNNVSLVLFNCERPYLIGKAIKEISPELQPNEEKSTAMAQRIYELVQDGQPQVFDWKLLKANGEEFDVSVSLNLVQLGSDYYTQAVLRDITEKKRVENELAVYREKLEDMVELKTKELVSKNEELQKTLQELRETEGQLLQAEKMASVGVLAAGVAHEINNPLNFIQGGYHAINRYFEENGINDEELHIHLSNIKDGVSRSVGIVSNLSKFNRINDTHEEACNIDEIIENCLDFSHELIKNTKIERRFTPEETTVIGNMSKLHQVFINLIINACQAVEQGGEVIIETSKQEQEVVILIMDTGLGIPKEDQKKILDPFFTTREPGKGTGLGLWITHNLVQDHHGKLKITSDPGLGTTVEVRLPVRK